MGIDWAAIDWAAVAAIATCVGVVVNTSVVVVALLPVLRAKKEHETRGLLTAAYFKGPLSRAYKQMFLACADLKLTTQTNAEMNKPDLLLSIGRLHTVPDRVRQLLGKFNLADAAYLDADQGKQLALAIGKADSVLEVLAIAVRKIETIRQQFETTMAHTPDGEPMLKITGAFERAHRNVIEEFKFLPAQFETATDSLGVFAQYCERLFPSDN